MAADLKVALLLQAKGGQATVGDLAKIQAAVERVKQETEDLNAITRTLTKSYNLSQEQAAKLAQEIQGAAKAAGGLQNLLQGMAQGAGQRVFDLLLEGVSAIPQEVARSTLAMEKFRTVLTTSLGGSQAADQALDSLKQFAATTPFQLEEVVQAFIKLQNRGIKPTNDTLTQLGDIAASQGKSLDQIVEAVLDASTGENERLKEFGIQAQKVGDQIQFTFKGVTQTVAATPDAITQAILGFGKLEGVQGGMESLSRTLGGQLSTLQDTASNLAEAFGSELVPVLAAFVQAITESGGSLESFARSAGQGTAQTLQLIGNAVKFVADNGKILEVILQTLLLRFVAMQAVALVQFLASTALGMEILAVASGKAAVSLTLLNVQLQALAAKAALALGPLVALAGAVAFTGLVKGAKDIQNTEDRINELANASVGLTNQSVRLASQLKALNQAEKQQGSLTAEQQQRRQALIKLVEDQIQANEAQIKSLQAIVPATAEQKAGIDSEIASYQRLNQTLQAQIANRGQAAKATQVSAEAQKKAAQAAADALKEEQEAAKRQAEQDFGDAQRNARQSFQDDQQAKEEQFRESQQAKEEQFKESQQAKEEQFREAQQAKEEQFKESQQAKEEQFKEAQQAKEEQFKARERALDEQSEDARRSRQKAFAKQQRSEEAAFERQQQEERKAFDKAQQLQKEAAEKGFSARRQQLERELQLEEAKTAKERKQLEKQFAEEDAKQARRNAKFASLEAEEKAFQDRQSVEGDVFQAAQKAAEEAQREKQRAEEEAFREKERQIAAQEEDAKRQRQKEFDLVQREEQKAFDVAQREEQKAFEAAQREEQKAFDVAQREEQKAFDLARRKEQKDFETAQREEQRAFDLAQRDEERAFKEEQRQLDKANAQAVKAILESVKIPSPVAAAPEARRMGGSVEAGQPYLVGEAGPELIFPSKAGYVATARQTQAILAQSPSAAPAPTGSGSQQQVLLLREVKALRRDLAAKPSPKQQNIINIVGEPDPYGRVAELASALARRQISDWGLS